MTAGFSKSLWQPFRRRVGANYVDVEFILERRPGASFDEALAYFLKFCQLDLNPHSISG